MHQAETAFVSCEIGAGTEPEVSSELAVAELQFADQDSMVRRRASGSRTIGCRKLSVTTNSGAQPRRWRAKPNQGAHEVC